MFLLKHPNNQVRDLVVFFFLMKDHECYILFCPKKKKIFFFNFCYGENFLKIMFFFKSCFLISIKKNETNRNIAIGKFSSDFQSLKHCVTPSLEIETRMYIYFRTLFYECGTYQELCDFNKTRKFFFFCSNNTWNKILSFIIDCSRKTIFI